MPCLMFRHTRISRPFVVLLLLLASPLISRVHGFVSSPSIELASAWTRQRQPAPLGRTRNPLGSSSSPSVSVSNEQIEEEEEEEEEKGLNGNDDCINRNSIVWRRTTANRILLNNNNNNNPAGQPLPCLASMDAHGELPLGAYTVHGKAQFDPKDTCRVSLALDCTKRTFEDEIDVQETVRSLQAHVDDGLQTFHVKSTAFQYTIEEVLGRFLSETPGFARDKSNIIIPLRIPREDAITPVVSCANMVRRQVVSSLLRLGSEAIDCIQIQSSFPKGKSSPYLLDVLDALQDLQREGLVRSVSARDLSPRQIRHVRANGLDNMLDSSQLDMNLLNPLAYTVEQKILSCDLELPLLVASPLAGGLLSNRYLDCMFEPFSTQLSKSERHHLKTTLPAWNNRCFTATTHDDDKKMMKKKMTAWQRYYNTMLPALAHVARKHGVSIATVSLRWVLQQKHVSSTIVSWSLLSSDNEQEGKTAQRIKEFRSVFRFELDDEDMALLWELSGVDEPPDELIPFDENEAEATIDRFEQRNGLFLP